MFKFVFLFIALLSANCVGVSSATSINRSENLIVDRSNSRNCSVDAEELKEVFNFKWINTETDKPEEDKDLIIIKRLRSCPLDETANSLLALRNNSNDDIKTKAKSTYLLVKIGYRVTENAGILVDLYSQSWTENINRYQENDYAEKVEKGLYADTYTEPLLTMISDIVENDDNSAEFISKVLEIETDGALSQILAGICGDEFKKNPETFLRIVKTKSTETRENVLLFIAAETTEKELNDKLSSISPSSEVYSLAEELRQVSSKVWKENFKYSIP